MKGQEKMKKVDVWTPDEMFLQQTDLASQLAQARIADLEAKLAELLQVTLGYKEWVIAVPDEVAASLPAMPGIDGDWADEVIDGAQRALKK